MTFRLSKKSLDKLDGVHPKMVELCLEAINVSPIDFTIVQGVRTRKHQEALYAQGRKGLNEVNHLRKQAGLGKITENENDKVVTWTLESNHIQKSDGYGWAVDFAAIDENGKITWDTNYYAPIANTFKASAKRMGLKITCGIDWNPRDWGHIQIEL